MTVAPYKIYVVVDREFSEKLAALEAGVPVWIVDTPLNRAVTQRLWDERPKQNHLTGITIFKNWETLSPEDLLISELDTIDLHHGSYSADPPYTVLEVFGTQLSEKIKTELSEYGFEEFHQDSESFRAVRLKEK